MSSVVQNCLCGKGGHNVAKIMLCPYFYFRSCLHSCKWALVGSMQVLTCQQLRRQGWVFFLAVLYELGETKNSIIRKPLGSFQLLGARDTNKLNENKQDDAFCTIIFIVSHVSQSHKKCLTSTKIHHVQSFGGLLVNDFIYNDFSIYDID